MQLKIKYYLCQIKIIIMILTGKTFKEFGLFIINNHKIASWEYFDRLPKSCQNALIIDFFDSIGFKIIIIPTMFTDDWGCDIFGWTECEKSGLGSRLEAQNEGIIKANELHNISAQNK